MPQALERSRAPALIPEPTGPKKAPARNTGGVATRGFRNGFAHPRRGTLSSWFAGAATWSRGRTTCVSLAGNKTWQTGIGHEGQLGLPICCSSTGPTTSTPKGKPRRSSRPTGGEAAAKSSRVNPPATSAKILSAISIMCPPASKNSAISRPRATKHPPLPLGKPARRRQIRRGPFGCLWKIAIQLSRFLTPAPPRDTPGIASAPVPGFNGGWRSGLGRSHRPLRPPGENSPGGLNRFQGPSGRRAR